MDGPCKEKWRENDGRQAVTRLWKGSNIFLYCPCLNIRALIILKDIFPARIIIFKGRTDRQPEIGGLDAWRALACSGNDVSGCSDDSKES